MRTRGVRWGEDLPAASCPTSRSLTVDSKRTDTLPASTPAMIPTRTPTTVRKGNLYATAVQTVAGENTCIVRPPSNVRTAPQKNRCTPGSFRTLVVHCEESSREAVRALAGTPAYVRSQRERGKIEALFSELKQRLGLRRVRLRRFWNVAEQFLLAATAQNIKRLVKFLAQQRPRLQPRTL